MHVGRDCDTLAALEKRGYVDLNSFTSQGIEVLKTLIAKFWPGPLTLVLPKGKKISPVLAKGLNTVGFRMPDHSVFLGLIEKSGCPLAAPSANKANRISPTSADHVFSELQGAIPFILDGGKSRVGLESTILKVSLDGKLTLLRYGGLSLEEVEKVTQQKVTVSSGVQTIKHQE